MYLPESKYKKTTGVGKNLLDTTTGRIYTGPVIQDYLGNYLKGDNPYTAEDVLIPTFRSSSIRETPIQFYYIQPTEQDYQVGSFIRYFVKDSRDGKIVELNYNAYLNELENIKPYRKAIKIEWYISGELEDKKIGNYIYPGIKSKNLDVIKQAELELPGIGEQILKDPGQFVK